MFNTEGFNKLGEDIYVYNNFMSDAECKEMCKVAEFIKDDNWMGIAGQERSREAIEQIVPIHDRIKCLLDKEVYLGSDKGIVRMKKGAIGKRHSDSFDFMPVREASARLKDGEDFKLAENIISALILYFNDFEGGDLYYAAQGISYKPKRGDLVIHSSEKHCMHQVNEVKSEFRYSHSNHFFNYIKVPKEFDYVP